MDQFWWCDQILIVWTYYGVVSPMMNDLHDLRIKWSVQCFCFSQYCLHQLVQVFSVANQGKTRRTKTRCRSTLYSYCIIFWTVAPILTIFAARWLIWWVLVRNHHSGREQGMHQALRRCEPRKECRWGKLRGTSQAEPPPPPISQGAVPARALRCPIRRSRTKRDLGARGRRTLLTLMIWSWASSEEITKSHYYEIY